MFILSASTLGISACMHTRPAQTHKPFQVRDYYACRWENVTVQGDEGEASGEWIQSKTELIVMQYLHSWGYSRATLTIPPSVLQINDSTPVIFSGTLHFASIFASENSASLRTGFVLNWRHT